MKQRLASTRSVFVFLLAVAGVSSVARAQLSYYALTPCRVVDTRSGFGGVLTSFNTRTFTVKGLCGVPTTAKAISVNATIATPGGTGFLTLFPTGVTKPYVSTIDWTSSDNALANGALVPLGSASTNELSAYEEEDGNGQVQLILDVTGYFK